MLLMGKIILLVSIASLDTLSGGRDCLAMQVLLNSTRMLRNTPKTIRLNLLNPFRQSNDSQVRDLFPKRGPQGCRSSGSFFGMSLSKAQLISQKRKVHHRPMGDGFSLKSSHVCPCFGPLFPLGTTPPSGQRPHVGQRGANRQKKKQPFRTARKSDRAHGRLASMLKLSSASRVKAMVSGPSLHSYFM